MSHADAVLSPRARLKLAILVVESGWLPTVAAKMFMVSTVHFLQTGRPLSRRGRSSIGNRQRHRTEIWKHPTPDRPASP